MRFLIAIFVLSSLSPSFAGGGFPETYEEDPRKPRRNPLNDIPWSDRPADDGLGDGVRHPTRDEGGSAFLREDCDLLL